MELESSWLTTDFAKVILNSEDLRSGTNKVADSSENGAGVDCIAKIDLSIVNQLDNRANVSAQSIHHARGRRS